MKTAISISDELFQAGDRVARQRGISRSGLYCEAIKNYLRLYDDHAITDALDRVYADQNSTLDCVLDAMQLASLSDEGW